MRIGLSRVMPAALTALIVGVSSLALAAPLASNDPDMTNYGETGDPLEVITATVGQPCSVSSGSIGAAMGAMAFTTDGKLLTCQSGVWGSVWKDTALLDENGFVEMPSGVIFQWGRRWINPNQVSGQFVPFVKPYPNGCLNITVSSDAGNTHYPDGSDSANCAREGFTGWVWNIGQVTPVNSGHINYFSVGY